MSLLDADGGRGPEPRNAGGLWKLEKMRKQSLPQSLLKESRLVDAFKEGRVRPISDLSLVRTILFIINFNTQANIEEEKNRLHYFIEASEIVYPY